MGCCSTKHSPSPPQYEDEFRGVGMVPQNANTGYPPTTGLAPPVPQQPAQSAYSGQPISEYSVTALQPGYYNLAPYDVPPPSILAGNYVSSAPPAVWCAFSQTKASTTREIETMLLLDITGSMCDPVSRGGTVSRKSTVREAIGLIVEELGAKDSQAQHEAHGGGLRTVTFADKKAEDIEDLNTGNLTEKWKAIQWGGGTYIVPGWKKLQEVYQEEFGERAKEARPILLALTITDGAAIDILEFEAMLTGDTHSYCLIALLGYGDMHDKALQSFTRVAERNPRMKVIPFEGDTSSMLIAQTLLQMIK